MQANDPSRTGRVLEFGPDTSGVTLELELVDRRRRSPAVDELAPPRVSFGPWLPPERHEAVRAPVNPLAGLPVGIWKRVAAYPLLFGVLANGCTCRGLSVTANLCVAALVLLGLVGLVTSRARSV